MNEDTRQLAALAMLTADIDHAIYDCRTQLRILRSIRTHIGTTPGIRSDIRLALNNCARYRHWQRLARIANEGYARDMGSAERCLTAANAWMTGGRR